jgi:hypothetical protein
MDCASGKVRRALSRKFGYWLIYEIHPTHLVVLAVWHGTRQPEGWRAP